ncbi:unnamed protein product [Brassicogethes aeneus]|uniref:Integrase catalytic domain-containing protein n=1 Tax=Brassicogethes aeneus TaxID=1431903 RepID=A0A9P0FM67_BRAAE|nr:unnamed protein product [Brassicogethes aeneus]
MEGLYANCEGGWDIQDLPLKYNQNQSYFRVIEELVQLWPNCRIVHGKPRHSRSQGSVERANQDIENKLASWMKDNNSTKWSEGLGFVQFYKNRCFHSGIGRSPYEALFGVPCRDGLNDLPVSSEKIRMLKSEEYLELLLKNSNDEDTLPKELKIQQTTTENEEQNYIIVDSLNELRFNENNLASYPSTSTSDDILILTIEDTLNNTIKEYDIPEKNLNPIEVVENIENLQSCTICKEDNLCSLSKNRQNIENIRNQCREAQKRQAEKMLQVSSKKFKSGDVGMTVRVPIPDVDRSRSDHRNILAIIMCVEDNFYRLGTVHGVLKQLFSRNQFDLCKQNSLSLDDVKKDTEISLRIAVRKLSVSGSTQGYNPVPKSHSSSSESDDEIEIEGSSSEDEIVQTIAVVEGDFVIVNCDGQYYPEVLSLNENKVQISHMQKSGLFDFRWPAKPDILDYDEPEIFKIIGKPQLVNKRGHIPFQKWLNFVLTINNHCSNSISIIRSFM